MKAAYWLIYALTWIVLLLVGLGRVGAAPLRTAAQAQATPGFVPAPGGAVTGLCIDIFRALERRDGALRFGGDQQWLPPARLAAELERGQLDVACGMLRREQHGGLALLAPPLFQLRYRLLARAGDAVVLRRWEQLPALPGGAVVLSLHGAGQTGQLRALGPLAVDAGTADVQHNLDKLLAGRGRFFYAPWPNLNPLIQPYCRRGQLRLVPGLMHCEAAYMMVGAQLPAATRARLQAALGQLKRRGELDALLRKWQVAGAADRPC